MKSALIITPTVGSEKLIDAIISVRNQTYKNTKHLIVLDGKQVFLPMNCIVYHDLHTIDQIRLTYPTGANGFYGHRIYAGMSKLVDADYVFFLDEDNWLEPEHVESLIDTMESNQYDFAFSLRKIYDKNKNFICNDDCESLGGYPILGDEKNGYLVDTSSYGFKHNCYRNYGHIWDAGWGGDRRFFQVMRTIDQVKYGNSGQYTLNYRLDGNSGSVTPEFFQNGNTTVAGIFPDKPWMKK